MNAKKIVRSIIYSLAIFIMFTACAVQREIDKLIFVRTVAVDKSTKDEGVRLTVASESGSSNGKQVETQKKAMRLHAEGKTVFDANRKFSTFEGKYIFWGHAKYIVLGEEVCRKDVLKYLDFFIRNHENRLNASIAVVRNADGSELLESTGDISPHKKLSGIYANSREVSVSKEILLSEFIEKLSSKYSSAYLPCIRIFKEADGNGNDGGKKDIKLEGFAVFKGKSLLDYITDKKARGLNWINGNVKSGVIVVKDHEGNSVSLEIIDTDVKISTSIKNGIPGVTVKMKVSANLAEDQGQMDVFNKEDIERLEKQQTDIIKDEAESVIEFAQKNNVDILGFGDKIFHEHPVKWESIKGKWLALFPKINVKVEIESKINRSYNIRQPIRFWEEKKK